MAKVIGLKIHRMSITTNQAGKPTRSRARRYGARRSFARTWLSAGTVTGRILIVAVRSGTTPMVLDGLGDDLEWANGRGALVIDRLDGGDHQFDAEAVMDKVVPSPTERVRVRVVAEQADDGRRQGVGVMRRHEQPGDPVLDHLRDAP